MSNSMNRVFSLLALLSLSSACFACATLAYDPVRTTDESALIVWNSKTKTEQFVRRASFESKAKDFGFLVPTPTRPQLSSANDAIFDSLENELKPKTVVQTQRGVDFTPLVASIFASKDEEENATASNSPAYKATGSTNSVKSVEVVEQKRVGAYNAVVLRASDTKSLSRWLKRHRYPVSSDTRDWLAPYVKNGFFVTVFQIASDAQSQSAQAQAVRLSFKSDAPFFPYREPKKAQKIGGGRTLRVFLVSNERMSARIEDGQKSANWPAMTSHSAPLQSRELKSQLGAMPGQLRLTAFEDFSSPRPGWGDLKFSRAKEQRAITPPPHIIRKDERRWIPADVLALGVLMLVGWGLRRREYRALANRPSWE